MNTVLDGLKERLEAAKARLALAQQRWQAVQSELQAATQNHAIWSSAVQIEMAEEAAKLAEAQAKQIPMELPTTEAPRTEVPESDSANSGEPQTESINKTELIREQLQGHSHGMTPTDLWKAVGSTISNRAYLYSILKRLRDRDEIVLRRGKYFIKVKPAEVQEKNETSEVATTIQ